MTGIYGKTIKTKTSIIESLSIHIAIRFFIAEFEKDFKINVQQLNIVSITYYSFEIGDIAQYDYDPAKLEAQWQYDYANLKG